MDNRLRVICVGAASQDVFLTGKVLTAKRDVKTSDYVEQFPLGAKLELDGVYFDVGGGATNAAVTFARQGFKVSFAGKVGHDPAGNEVIRAMRREGISTDLMAYDSKLTTAYSTILLAPRGERTVLVYRGASSNLSAQDFPIRNFESEWLYISSLDGNLSLLKRLLKHANNRGIQVAINPGSSELNQARKFRQLLPLIAVLVGNRDELGRLFGGDEPAEILRNAAGQCPCIVLTDGPNGSFATDGERLYAAGQYQKVKVYDRTGAGDAFASGFVAEFAKSGRIESALTLGSANATAVVTKIGAKAGILRTPRLKRMKVREEAL